MTAGLSRRALFSRLGGGGTQLRPPWSHADALFTEACSLCGDCLTACPTGLLVKGRGGYPVVDFSKAHCTFCGSCRDACKAGCFTDAAVGGAGIAWPLKASIGATCIESSGVMCRVCENACETAAIRFRPRLGGGSTASIDLAACTGCGQCVATCPAKAISITNGAQARHDNLETVS